MKTTASLFAALALSQPASQPPRPTFSDGARTFELAKAELLKSYYRDDLTEDELYRAAVQGMLERIDPKLAAYNDLLTPEENAELQDRLAGQLVGVGAQLRMEEDSGLVDVLAVMASSPAEAAGIQAGDKILTVDGQSFKGRSLDAVVSAIRGPEGQAVRLRILQGTSVVEKNVPRRRVTWQGVHHERVADGVELLSLTEFDQRTPAAVRTALDEIAASHPKGLVVDLRHNRGGELEASLATAKLLLPKGTPIARIVHRGHAVETVTADGSSRLPPLPAVVLVNGDTMSSAELLAAALRTGLKAPVMGSTTKGKWSIQRLKELPNRYVLKYTVATFEAPDGASYEGVGMPPDVEVALDGQVAERLSQVRDPAARLSQDAQLRAAVNLLRLRP